MLREVSCIDNNCWLLCLPVYFAGDGADEIVGVMHIFYNDSMVWLGYGVELCFEFFLDIVLVFDPLFVVEYCFWILPVVVELIWSIFYCFFIADFVIGVKKIYHVK